MPIKIDGDGLWEKEAMLKEAKQAVQHSSVECSELAEMPYVLPSVLQPVWPLR